MDEFRLDPDADINHTYLRGKVLVPPSRMVSTFGPPEEGDGYKVSGTYTFTDAAGNVFTVYDWKETSLFDEGLAEGEESVSPTPEEFWGNWNPDVLHIGGRDGGDVEAFRRWLLEQTGTRGDRP